MRRWDKKMFRRIKRMWENESAFATCNLCMPMGWMTCGAFLESIGGTYFGPYGKCLTLFCG